MITEQDRMLARRISVVVGGDTFAIEQAAALLADEREKEHLFTLRQVKRGFEISTSNHGFAEYLDRLIAATQAKEGGE